MDYLPDLKHLPGTTVEVNENISAKDFLDSAFATNGLVLSQIVQLTALEPHTIQNWVKRKFIEPPVSKKYDCNQFCRIAMINMLKDIFNIERIIKMLDYAKAQADSVDETFIYTAFSDVIAAIPPDALLAQTDVDGIINGILDKHRISGDSQKRLSDTLKIMVLAFISARVRGRAEFLLIQIEQS